MGYPSVVMLHYVRPCLASTLPLRRLLMGLMKEAAMLGVVQGAGNCGQRLGAVRSLRVEDSHYLQQEAGALSPTTSRKWILPPILVS